MHFTDRIVDRLKSQRRVIVAIAGIPGSGKTTLAEKLRDALNDRLGPDTSVCCPMDGFHLYKARLDEEGRRIRGHHSTFDPNLLLSRLSLIAHQLDSDPPNPAKIGWPSFDHSLGDPVEDDITILPVHKVVVLEGLYLHMTLEPWCKVTADEFWFLEVDEEEAVRRLVGRHVRTGVAKSEEEARNRVLGSDMVNAGIVKRDRREATLVLRQEEVEVVQ
ncbi:putative kinase [Irineochytrium annulatum]|nr:putative kinase [Irineochytrium annulatum]